jgi:methylisocitrate lyase
MSNDLGYPDIGLTTLSEVSYRAAQIARITNLPTICDADTGFKSQKKQFKLLKKPELSPYILKIKLIKKDVVIWIIKN